MEYDDEKSEKNIYEIPSASCAKLFLEIIFYFIKRFLSQNSKFSNRNGLLVHPFSILSTETKHESVAY